MQVLPLNTAKRTRTTSEMSTFLTCRRKYQLRNVQHLRPKQSKGWALWGSAFHKLDELVHSGQSLVDALAQSRTVFYGNDGCSEQLTESWEGFVQVAAQYVEAHPTETINATGNVFGVRELHSGLRFYTDLLEVPFKVPIFTPGGRRSAHAEYAGIFDGIVEDANGSLWLYETKTAATLTEAFFDKLGFDRQTLRYVYAARQIFGDRVKGVLYNAVCKVAARQPDVRQDGTLSTAAVIATPGLLKDALLQCLDGIRERAGEKVGSCEDVAMGWAILPATQYLAHVLNEDTEAAWGQLTHRVQCEPAGKAQEASMKRIEKAKADQAKYRDLMQSAERRLFHARRYREVDNETLEEIQWELYELDRDIHHAEQAGRFFPNDRACDQMGGCDFRDLCLKGKSDQYEEAPKRHVELPPEGFLTPTHPRPVRSALVGVLTMLQDHETRDME